MRVVPSGRRFQNVGGISRENLWLQTAPGRLGESTMSARAIRAESAAATGRPADGAMGRPSKLLGNLHRVQGSAFPQLVAADEHLDAPPVRLGNVTADPPDEDVVLA